MAHFTHFLLLCLLRVVSRSMSVALRQRSACIGEVRAIARTVWAARSLDPAFASPCRWFASKNKHKSVSQQLVAQQTRRTTTPPHSSIKPSPATPTPSPSTSTPPPSSPPPTPSTPVSSSPPSAPNEKAQSEAFDSEAAHDHERVASDWKTRLTETQHDRDLLRRALQLSGVFMAITLLANGLRVTGAWDELMAWLRPEEAEQPETAVDPEDEEDELLAEQLYREHQRWAEQQERDQATARQLELDRRRALEQHSADDARASEAGSAAQPASTEQSTAASSPHGEPAAYGGAAVAVNT